MGADVVIAVDLSAGLVGRNLLVNEAHASRVPFVADWLRRGLGRWWHDDAVERRRPSVLNVIATSLDVMQVRITRSRMAGEPPDLVVAPRLAGIGLLDFHRADEAIHEGERAMAAALDNLAVLGIETAAS
jgi:NTE family protein